MQGHDLKGVGVHPHFEIAVVQQIRARDRSGKYSVISGVQRISKT